MDENGRYVNYMVWTRMVGMLTNEVDENGRYVNYMVWTRMVGMLTTWGGREWAVC